MLSNPHRAVIYRAYYLERSAAQIAAEYQIAESACVPNSTTRCTSCGRNLRDVHVTV